MRTTQTKINTNQKVQGLPVLAKLMTPDAAKRALQWLNTGSAPTAFGDRPEIFFFDGQLAEAVDAAERAMLAMPDHDIFQRGGELVRLIPKRLPGAGGTRKKRTEPVQISPVASVTLEEIFERAAIWIKSDGRAKDNKRRISCPPRVARAYLARRKWAVPVLDNIVHAPTLRSDGTVLSKRGYDAASGLFLAGTAKFPSISEPLTLKDAEAALATLAAPLKDFPFVDDADRSVALAAIMTALVRRSLPSAPLFGFTAPTMSSGKTLLAHVVSLIATGRAVTTMSYARNAEEDQKQLFAALREGQLLVCFDNVSRPISGDTLCQMLTSNEYSGRVLGQSQMATVNTNCVFLSTGNNLTLQGDMRTRALVCAIDPKLEKPEERAFNRDLYSWVPARRKKLVAAALTLMRAYIAAGMPDVGLKPWGRFEIWSDWVRAPLVWLGEADPCDTRKRIEQDDPEHATLETILTAWREVYRDNAVTAASAALKFAANKDPATLAALLEATGSKSDEIDPRALGRYISTMKGRIIDGLKFDEGGIKQGTKRWRVVAVN